MINLVPVVTDEQVEWLRVSRNDPQLYKYFRQDNPITKEDQSRWWKSLNQATVRLFILETGRKEKVGYIGFNPFNLYAGRGEIGLFVLPEYQNKGYAKEAVLKFLRKGFCEWNLNLVYSDCLQYPGEDKFGFWKKFGFEPYAEACQGLRYKKQGQWIASLRFFMMRDTYEKLYYQGEDDYKNMRELELDGKTPLSDIIAAKKKRGRPRLHPSPQNVQSAAG